MLCTLRLVRAEMCRLIGAVSSVHEDHTRRAGYKCARRLASASASLHLGDIVIVSSTSSVLEQQLAAREITTQLQTNTDNICLVQ